MTATATHFHKHPYPGVRVTCNGNQLVAQHVEARITEGGVFFPITPSTEGGELYQQSFAQGELNVWGQAKIAIEAQSLAHAAKQGGHCEQRLSGLEGCSIIGQNLTANCDSSSCYLHPLI